MRRLWFNIFVGTWILLCMLILSVSAFTTLIAVVEHRKDAKAGGGAFALNFGIHLEKYVLWDDRLAIKNLLDSTLGRAEAAYSFIEYKGRPYAHTFAAGVPRAFLAQPHKPGEKVSAAEFVDQDGRVLYDVSVPILDGSGRLHLGLSRAAIDAATLRSLRPAFFLAFFALVLGAFLAAGVARWTTRDVARMTDALRESEGRMRSLLETLPLGVFELDRAGVITAVNPGCVAIMRRGGDELVGKPVWWLLVPGRQKRGLPAYLRRILRERPAPSRYYTRVLTGDGRMIDVEVEWNYAPDRRGNAQGLVCTLADITESRRAEKERRRLEVRIRQARKLESLGVLAGGIAHDFNNLLATILGNAELILEDVAEDSPERGKIMEMRTASRRAAELCHHMLAYSGRARFHEGPVRLSGVAEEAHKLVEAGLSKKVTLEFTLPEGLPLIRGDATQIHQIVMNLLTNATEAVPAKGGVVKVATGIMQCDATYLRDTYLREDLPGGNYVFLTVSDNGPGMDAATIEKIFDPFFTTKFVGKGLGLAGVLGIVRGHRGALAITSRPGRGTRFRVFFPVPATPLEPDTARPEDDAFLDAENWRGEGKVLLIDDERQVRTLARELLARLGFAVVETADAREGLARFKENPEEFAFVLLDLSMPHMSGEEALIRLRALRTDIRVILTSGFDEADTLMRFAAQGPTGFIPKPFELSSFRREVRKAAAPR